MLPPTRWADRIVGGKCELDLLVTGGTVVDVLTETLVPANVGVRDGRVVFVGAQEEPAAETLDARGAFVLPGLIDGHLHLESSMLSPPQFAAAVTPRGTAACVCDPHEIANVLGMSGIEFLLEASESLPVDLFFTAPSCVPATTLETAGAEIGAEEIARLLRSPRVVGLGEMMNFPGVLAGDPEVCRKLEVARASGKAIDGHCPGLLGEALQAYVAAGPQSDHECTELDEAKEKLSAGMHLMLREGSAARNLDTLLPAVTDDTVSRCLFVSDDRHPVDLVERGHLDLMVQRAVEAGMPPARAVRLASLNAARYFGLDDRGALAPGRRADLCLFESWEAGAVRAVVKEGAVVVGEGARQVDRDFAPPPNVLDTVRLPPLTEAALSLPRCKRARAIGLVPGQIVTESLRVESACGAWPDPDRDLLKLVVIERHGRAGTLGVGLLKGFGLRDGALAGTIAHDSHNLVAVGVSDFAILRAARELARVGGGLTVVEGHGGTETLPLPIAGLMSSSPLGEIVRKARRLREAACRLGARVDDPFGALSFLALPVIPALKLTDLGLVELSTDGSGFGIVELEA